MAVQDESAVTAREADDARAAVISYHAAIDRGRAGSGLALFAEDAHFEAKGSVLLGHGEIGRFLRQREQQLDRHTVHVLANERIGHTSSTEVELAAFVLLHVRNRSGEYVLERVLDTVHRVRKTPDGWRITHRFSRPLHASPQPESEEHQ